MRNLQKKIISKVIFIHKHRKGNFVEELNKEKEFFSMLPEGKDLIQRSYLQYKCQQFQYGTIFNILSNFASIPLIIMYALKGIIGKHDADLKIVDLIFTHTGMDDKIIPSSLKESNTILSKRNFEEGFILNKGEWRFLIDIIRRYPMSPYFLYKVMMKIGMYGSLIERYRPKIILTCSEFSFTSSIVTQYCDYKGVKHYNTMHGEKIFNIRDSFFSFHQCYVWDDYYIKLFKKLKAEPNQFIVELPESMQINRNKVNIEGIQDFDFKYYLAMERNEEVVKIGEMLNKIKEKGYKVGIRMHPRHVNIHGSILKEMFEKYEIEDPYTITIEQSLLTTNNIISKYSTVLHQASLLGINIIIDDITDYETYQKICAAEYKLVMGEHIVLSEYINKL